jgi:hypothetical protein
VAVAAGWEEVADGFWPPGGDAVVGLGAGAAACAGAPENDWPMSNRGVGAGGPADRARRTVTHPVARTTAAMPEREPRRVRRIRPRRSVGRSLRLVVTDLTVLPDDFPVLRLVIVVVTPEAAVGVHVSQVVRVRAPGHLHGGEHVIRPDVLRAGNGALDFPPSAEGFAR